ncbi:MAG: GNAT family N-acetyltransferase, partial [Gammaproteobacteria bacterium]
MVEFEVRSADWRHDRAALREIRTRVFIEEQKVPVELEWDSLDADCIHVLAWAGDQAVGTGRLTPDGHIGRMAVLAHWRGRGVGARLLAHLVDVARERGGMSCHLDAQVSA